jgi:hypothetical protein
MDCFEGDRIRAGHVVEQGAKLTVAHRRAWRAGGGQRVVSGDAPTTCICSHPTTGVGSCASDLCRAGAIGHVPGTAQIRAAKGNAKPRRYRITGVTYR